MLLHFDTDITSHPVSRLPSRRPIWQEEWSKKISTPSQWLEEWLFADTVNGSLVADPSIQIPGFNSPRRLWCTLNRFRTGQGRFAASLTRWQHITDPTCCDCGAPQQTMMHIVEDCPVTRFPSGLPALHLVDENALIWLDTQSKG